MTIERVGVIGGGLMGSRIAEISARTGHDSIVHEIDGQAAAAAMKRFEKSLAQAVEKGKLKGNEADTTQGRIRFSTDLVVVGWWRLRFFETTWLASRHTAEPGVRRDGRTVRGSWIGASWGESWSSTW